MGKPTPRTYAVATMYAGMVATLAGNAATADWSSPIAVVIAAFPALALFLTFEMVMRSRPNPSKRRWYHHTMRLVPAVAIMSGAAYVSVGHLVELAHTHGQHGAKAWVFALLPDAMMLLAAVVLKDSPQARTAPARKPATAKAAAPAPAPAKTPAKAPARKPAARKPRAKAAPITAPAPSVATLVMPTVRRAKTA